MKSSNIALILAIISTLCTISLAQNFIKHFLDAHNKARAGIGLKPLTWNSTLAAYAEKYAKSRMGDCKLEHSQGPFGENLAEGYGEFSCEEAVKMWLSEKLNYDHKENKCVNDECLHYTQIIWKNTLHLGCARQRCNNGGVIIVCSYYPPGNYIGEQPY
ncbi:hypothetical protein VNO78_11637 [Psophocarpus tetragonolobus]|uniref:SCP domain-containing protein n=1 Tax=Psophocarpus tetragonolobus TaxID=3891 RepID=A0AAN9SPN6_PSOTE